MRFWWVNQNQTFKQETQGGYLWSPQRNANLRRNPFYETMREVAPGDVILSFEGTHIRAFGIAKSYCYECPKPVEFGKVGGNWDRIGWKIDVQFTTLHHQIRPKDHIQTLRPHLPEKYSPLQEDGDGNQGVYLAALSKKLAEVLIGLVGVDMTPLLREDLVLERRDEEILAVKPEIESWENHIEETIQQESRIPETEKQALIQARRGQGLFKKNLLLHERRCRITGVERMTHLIASHCKPWRTSTNEERLDGENGLLLTPSIDHLFDGGLISFEDRGELLVSPIAHKPSLQRMGVETEKRVNVGAFSEGQIRYLTYHREYVFHQSNVG